MINTERPGPKGIPPFIAEGVARHPRTPTPDRSDWRLGLPTLADDQVTLRDLLRADAVSLVTMLTSPEVTRFISPPPTTVEDFERFIEWASRQREAGSFACFSVVPEGQEAPVGLFQLRRLELSWRTAEWGFVIDSAYWGSGMFLAGAQLLLDFAFETLRVHRLEARAAVPNGRGNGALRKMGAVCELSLRSSFQRSGDHMNQFMWSILDTEWQQAKASRARSHST